MPGKLFPFPVRFLQKNPGRYSGFEPAGGSSVLYAGPLILKRMKAVIFAGAVLLLFALVLACGCTSAPQSTGTTVTTPNLMGNWTGTWNDYTKDVGYSDGAGYSMVMSVTGQQDRIFWGTFYFTDQKGVTESETFAGAVGPDGKTVYIAEESDGYTYGTYTAPDQIELIYLLSGENYNAAIDTLKKS